MKRLVVLACLLTLVWCVLDLSSQTDVLVRYTRIGDLTDVNAPEPADTEVLVYNATEQEWQPDNVSAAGSGDMLRSVYDPGEDNDIDLAAGGTNASLSDPGADRIMFWDDSDTGVEWLTAGTGLTIAINTITVDLGTAIDTSEITDSTILIADFANEDWGDITIAGNVASVEDDSHNHVLTNIDAFGSAGLANRLSDETGTGAAVFAIGPSIYPRLVDRGSTPPTAEGLTAWDDTNDVIYVGDGATTKTFYSGASYGVTGYLDLPEIAEPAQAPTDMLRLYVEEIHGFSFFKYLDDGGMKREIVRDSLILGYNDSVSTILANRVVFASGSYGGVPTIGLARSNSDANMPAIGVTIEDIAASSYGRVMQVGLLEGQNTSALAVGNILYVHNTLPGLVRITPPTTPALTQEIGTVLVDDAADGAIQIIARGLTGDEVGTAQNTFYIGDGIAVGTNKTISFNSATDATIAWDETQFAISEGITIATGKNFTIGSTQWNSGDSIDGEQIANDTIDNDPIDWGSITYLGEAGLITTAVGGDATSYVGILASASGDQQLLTDGGITYNASSNTLTIDGIVANSDVIADSGEVRGSEIGDGTAVITGGAGTGFTSLVVDTTTIDGGTITDTDGDIGFGDDIVHTAGKFVATDEAVDFGFEVRDGSTTGTLFVYLGHQSGGGILKAPQAAADMEIDAAGDVILDAGDDVRVEPGGEFRVNPVTYSYFEDEIYQIDADGDCRVTIRETSGTTNDTARVQLGSYSGGTAYMKSAIIHQDTGTFTGSGHLYLCVDEASDSGNAEVGDYLIKLEDDGDIFMDVTKNESAGGTSLELEAGEVVLDTSSRRFKDNERPITDTSQLYELPPKIFDWIDGPNDVYGFVAEDVRDVLPNAVSYRYEKVVTEWTGAIDPNDDPNNVHQSIEYVKTNDVQSYDLKPILALAVKEIQNLNDRLTAAEAEIEKLKAASPTPIPSGNGFADPVALGILATVGFLMWLINRRKVAR